MAERLRDYMDEAGPGGMARYLRTRAKTPWRYLLEQPPQWCLGFWPGLPGLLVRALAYWPPAQRPGHDLLKPPAGWP